MKIMKDKLRVESVVAALKCDICGKVHSDEFEMQEFLRFWDTAGYGSRFIGDMRHWEIDICQDCIQSVLGKYIRVKDIE